MSDLFEGDFGDDAQENARRQGAGGVGAVKCGEGLAKIGDTLGLTVRNLAQVSVELGGGGDEQSLSGLETGKRFLKGLKGGLRS